MVSVFRPSLFASVSPSTSKNKQPDQKPNIHQHIQDSVHFGLLGVKGTIPPGEDILRREDYQNELLDKLKNTLKVDNPTAYVQNLDETGQIPALLRDNMTQKGFNLLSVDTPALPEQDQVASLQQELKAAKLPVRVRKATLGVLKNDQQYQLPKEPLTPNQKQTRVMNQTLDAIEMAKTSVGVATAIGVSNGLALEAINQFATDDQKKIWFRPLQTGALTYAFGLTESEHGSNPRGMDTTFERIMKKGEPYYRLEGNKKFIGNAAEVKDARGRTTHRGADFIVVFAVNKQEIKEEGTETKDSKPAKPGQIYQAFMVPRKLIEKHGKITSTGPKLGLREVNNGDFTFKDLDVPEQFLLGTPTLSLKEGEKDPGYQKLMDTLNISRIFVAAMAVGSAEASIEKAARYAETGRTQYGHKIRDFQAVAFRIRQQQAKTLAAKLMTIDAARKADEELQKAEPNTKKFEQYASMAKLFASETALENAYTLIRTLGGRGYLETPEGLGAPKLFRDAAVLPIYEGTSDIQRNIISRSVMYQAMKDIETLTGAGKLIEEILSKPIEFIKPLLAEKLSTTNDIIDDKYSSIIADLVFPLVAKQLINTLLNKNDSKSESELINLTLPIQRRLHILADIATYRYADELVRAQEAYWSHHPERPKSIERFRQQQLLLQFDLDSKNTVQNLYNEYLSDSLKNLERIADTPLWAAPE